MNRFIKLSSGVLFCLMMTSASIAQQRSPITKSSVSEVRRLGSTSNDISFIGPHRVPGQMVVNTRRSKTVFDEKASRFVDSPKYTNGVVDDTLLKLKELDSTLLYAGISQDGKRRIHVKPGGFVLEAGRVTSKRLEGHGASVAGFAFHPNRELVAVNVWEYDPAEEECRIGFSNIRVFTMDGMPVRQFSNAAGGPARLRFCPDGKLLAVANRNLKQLQLIDFSSGRKVHTFKCSSFVRSMGFHPNGKLIAFFESDKCNVRDVKSGKTVRTIEMDSSADGGGVLWSQNGDMLVVAHDGKVTFWESSTWNKKRELKLLYRGVVELAMTEDGARIFTKTKSLDKWNPKARMVESWGIF